MEEGERERRRERDRHGQGGGMLTILPHYLPGGRACEREGSTEETEEKNLLENAARVQESVVCQQSR